MTESLMHEPKIVNDEDAGVCFVECAICGKVLWYPEEVCKPAPPPLGINVGDGVGTKDKFGRA